MSGKGDDDLGWDGVLDDPTPPSPRPDPLDLTDDLQELELVSHPSAVENEQSVMPSADIELPRLSLPSVEVDTAPRSQPASPPLGDAIPRDLFGAAAPRVGSSGRPLQFWLALGAVGLVVIAGLAWLAGGRGATRALGMVSVSSNPDGADILVDGSPIGQKTPAQLFDQPVGQRMWITVVKPGYVSEPSAREVVVTESGLSAYFTLTRVASLEVRTSPGGAAVFVGDRRVPGRTPLTIPELPVDAPVKLRVELDDYVPVVEEKVFAADPQPWELALVRAVTVQITSEPSGAAVMAGERRLGETPLYDLALPEGQPIELSVSKDGFRARKRKLVPSTDGRYHFPLDELPLSRLPLSKEDRREARRLDASLGRQRRRVHGLKTQAEGLDERYRRAIDDPRVPIGARVELQTRLERTLEALRGAEDELESLRFDAEQLRARALSPER